MNVGVASSVGAGAVSRTPSGAGEGVVNAANSSGDRVRVAVGGMGVGVAVFVGDGVSLGVHVGGGVSLGVTVAVTVGVWVSVAPIVGKGVTVSVGVWVGMCVDVALAVSVGVIVGSGVTVSVGVAVGAGVSVWVGRGVLEGRSTTAVIVAVGLGAIVGVTSKSGTPNVHPANNTLKTIAHNPRMTCPLCGVSMLFIITDAAKRLTYAFPMIA